MNKIISKNFELKNPKDLILIDQEINIENLLENEVVCEVIYTAISPGTEVAAYNGLPALRDGNQYPRILGYCNVAKVIAKGNKVGKLQEDDLILTFQSHRSHFIIKESDFYVIIKSDSDLKKISTAYLFHLGYHALITGKAKFSHSIGIIGAGVLGITTAIMSNLIGANAFVFSNQEGSNNILDKYNAILFRKDNTNLEMINDYTQGIGLDIIINTSNLWEDWHLALKTIRKNGIIVNLGFPGRGEVLPTFNPLDPKFVYQKNLTIKALSYISDRYELPHENRFNLERNLIYINNLIIKNRIDPEDIITDEIHYTKLMEQYIKYSNRKDYMLTTVLSWKS